MILVFRWICLLSTVSLIVSCEPQVQAIQYGSDGCSYCRMTIVEDFYGSELLTKKGKAYKFDSIECLAAFVIKGEIDRDDQYGLFFTDVEDAGVLYPMDAMIFVQAKKLKSPMGLNLSAYRDPETADSVAELYFGEVMTWDAVLRYVETTWLK